MWKRGSFYKDCGSAMYETVFCFPKGKVDTRRLSCIYVRISMGKPTQIKDYLI